MEVRRKSAAQSTPDSRQSNQAMCLPPQIEWVCRIPVGAKTGRDLMLLTASSQLSVVDIVRHCPETIIEGVSHPSRHFEAQVQSRRLAAIGSMGSCSYVTRVMTCTAAVVILHFRTFHVFTSLGLSSSYMYVQA